MQEPGNCDYSNVCYHFGTGDNRQYVFGIIFNTAGSQAVTAREDQNGNRAGTATATIAETYLSAGFGGSTVQQGTALPLTVQAKDGGGQLVIGYRGTVQFTASSWGWWNWGPEVSWFSSYTFAAGDAGQHTFSGASPRSAPPAL